MIDGETICFAASPQLKRGPRPRFIHPSEAHRHRAARAYKSEIRKKNIAILDMETDPFDHETEMKVRPFLAVLYSLEFDPIIIWEEDFEKFKDKLISAIEALPEKFTIYAHNGGKFDYMFLVSRLRGAIRFKGRGIMSAKICGHELRDSFHIIPERLANIQKDVIDYENFKKENRQAKRQAIIDYCINDCRYLLSIVLHMIQEYGLKISIGQMAQQEIQKHYKVGKLSKAGDVYFRKWFFGGRVECLQGRGHWKQPLKLYDVNSMYSKAMEAYQHPAGASFRVQRGNPTDQTIFMDITCKNNGALFGRLEDGNISANIPQGRFLTTIHEYDVARYHGLIKDITINYCVDFNELTDFSKFVNPMYEKRLVTKSRMKLLIPRSIDWNMAQRDDLQIKYILNNAWGKYAQNPERYKEHFFCDPDQEPPREWWPNENGILLKSLPTYRNKEYAIYEKPNPGFRYNNVATGASITGAARAMLLNAIHNAENPIYCDTDSLICSGLSNVEIHPTKLGAWDLEKEIDELIVCGKKLYAYRVKGGAVEAVTSGLEPGVTIKSKGVSGLMWQEFLKMLAGETIKSWPNKAPTMTRDGRYFYMRRDIRATAPDYRKAA